MTTSASALSAPFEPQYPDADCLYADRRILDLDKMEPLVALPGKVINNAVGVSEVHSERIQQAFIGSCANGNFDDLKIAADVVRGRKVAAGVRFLITPGSQAIYRQALKAGLIETLMDAGAVVTNATCGACQGGHMGVLGPNETCITASTRNFSGRMGDPSARIYHGLTGDRCSLGADRRRHASRRIPAGGLSMLEGKVWLFGDDINTDLIAPTPYIYMPAKDQAKHVFEANRPGWVNEMRAGDFIVAGRNFGMGSSRPAPMVLNALSVGCVLADSINALFFRNCVSFGLLALECPGVSEMFQEGQRARSVSFEDFSIENVETGTKLTAVPVPASLIEMMQRGGIFPLLESEGLIAPRTGRRGRQRSSVSMTAAIAMAAGRAEGLADVGTRDTLLTAGGVRKEYETREGDQILALDRVALSLADGEFVSVVGPSGCGKSTLLKIIAGIEPPSEGNIRYRGHDGPAAAARHGRGVPKSRATTLAHCARERAAADPRVAAAAERRRLNAPTRCSPSWGCRASRTNIPPSSPAACSSASASRAVSVTTRACCSWTSRLAHSTHSRASA